jgi:hypothetical protein
MIQSKSVDLHGYLDKQLNRFPCVDISYTDILSQTKNPLLLKKKKKEKKKNKVVYHPQSTKTHSYCTEI